MTNPERGEGGRGAVIMSAEALADLAHELRAPLGGIDAMTDLLMERGNGAEQADIIAALKAASAHLRAVASSLVSPEDAARRRSMAAREVLDAFVVASRARAAARGFPFEANIEAACNGLRLPDGVAVRQILENLADNAMRLTAGGVNFTVTCREAGDGQPRVRLAIRDRGPGLTGADSQAVFGRGTVLPGRASGSGLGLSIVADIATRLGGSCGAAGLGEGAEFWVELPAMIAEVPEQAELRRVERLPVLIVDDDAANRAVLATALQSLGVETEVCPSPSRALALLREQRFGALMTDITMPEMDGITFIAAYRAMEDEGSRLPVIAVTGRTDAATGERLIQAGCDSLVEKPVTIHDLRQALRRAGLLDGPAVTGAKAA